MNNKTNNEIVNAVNENVSELFKRFAELEEENKALKKKLGSDNLPSPPSSQSSAAFDCIAVTNVQVFPFNCGANLGHIKGLATIVLNDQIQLRNLRVMDGENGLYVGYPNDLFYKGEDYRSICLPITRQLREHIENCVLEKYQAAIE